MKKCNDNSSKRSKKSITIEVLVGIKIPRRTGREKKKRRKNRRDTKKQQKTSPPWKAWARSGAICPLANSATAEMR